MLTLPTNWAASRGVMHDGRFRLYVSYACPWSHRVLIARVVSGVENAVEVVDVLPEMDDTGWRLGAGHLIDRYRTYAPGYTGKATVPLMIEVATCAIVSNESADLMRMLGSDAVDNDKALYPAEHAAACDIWNADVQTNVNAGVYQFGIAAADGDRASKTRALMETFARLEDHLASRRYLVIDDRPLEPDWRLWSSLARYDLAYRPHMLSPDAAPRAGFPHLDRFFSRLLAVDGIASTYRPEEFVRHYAARVASLKARASHH